MTVKFSFNVYVILCLFQICESIPNVLSITYLDCDKGCDVLDHFPSRHNAV